MPANPKGEYPVFVDTEYDGPTPPFYSMYQLGACPVFDRSSTFRRDLKLLPGSMHDPEYLAAVGVTIEQLRDRGDDPQDVMQAFTDWVIRSADGRTPVFVSAGVTDWSYVRYYLLQFSNAPNLFGHTSLDLKSYFMGLTGCRWEDTGLKKIKARFPSDRPHTHDALDDAIEGADMTAQIFRERTPEDILAIMGRRK